MQRETINETGKCFCQSVQKHRQKGKRMKNRKTLAIAKFFVLQANAKTPGKISQFPLECIWEVLFKSKLVCLVNVVVSYKVFDPFPKIQVKVGGDPWVMYLFS